ncbi:MAG: hypothetical protein CMM01_09135 [Rhodopirellula sp.]|nr:hypothetical protein [Rhodopirellula sp.]
MQKNRKSTSTRQSQHWELPTNLASSFDPQASPTPAGGQPVVTTGLLSKMSKQDLARHTALNTAESITPGVIVEA